MILGGAREMIEIEDCAECFELGLKPIGAKFYSCFCALVVPKLIACFCSSVFLAKNFTDSFLVRKRLVSFCGKSYPIEEITVSFVFCSSSESSISDFE